MMTESDDKRVDSHPRHPEPSRADLVPSLLVGAPFGKAPAPARVFAGLAVRSRGAAAVVIPAGSRPIGNNGTLIGDSEREGGQMTPATVPMHPPQARSVRAVTDRLLRAGYRLVGPILRGMPVEFLTDDEAAEYGRYAGVPSQAELEKIFFLDDEDRALVARRRGDHMKLGFALQLVTVRYVGLFLEDPLAVPAVVVELRRRAAGHRRSVVREALYRPGQDPV